MPDIAASSPAPTSRPARVTIALPDGRPNRPTPILTGLVPAGPPLVWLLMLGPDIHRDGPRRVVRRRALLRVHPVTHEPARGLVQRRGERGGPATTSTRRTRAPPGQGHPTVRWVAARAPGRRGLGGRSPSRRGSCAGHRGPRLRQCRTCSGRGREPPASAAHPDLDRRVAEPPRLFGLGPLRLSAHALPPYGVRRRRLPCHRSCRG